MFLRRQRRTEESGPYWRQPGWQLSAGFLALVVVIGGLVALTSAATGGVGGGPAETAASEGPLSAGAPLADGGRPEGCTTDDSAGEMPPKAGPGDIEWRTLGVGRVPVSASAGPTRFQGDLWWCFAHTPAGAALAATVIPSQMSESGWRTVTEQQLVPGAGRDMFEFQRSLSPDTSRRRDGSPASSYVGFSLTAYTPEAATVSLLIKGGQGFTATSIQVRWSDGDWKVRPLIDGSLYTEMTTVQDTNGYLLWGAGTP
ncbi:hypothetical protein ABZX40_30885 [Streptomyces sp. NPDC004610]|uniref:hypothetical protein n=1 Tax=unclassified Streptomyces TaxID=2593676 RepID=UPI0033ABF749